jgi:cytochrome c-type biogenesis protein CcmH
MGAIAVGLLISSAGRPPTEGTSDERLFALAAQLKCQQCVGESVAQSQSAGAVQFREEISAQMARGQTDDEILNFFADSYPGVLLNPPSTGVGALVWVIPVVVLAGALLLLAATFRRWRGEQVDRTVSDDDQARVDAALAERRDPTAPTDR